MMVAILKRFSISKNELFFFLLKKKMPSFSIDKFEKYLRNMDRVQIINMYDTSLQERQFDSIFHMFFSIVSNGDEKLILMFIERLDEWRNNVSKIDILNYAVIYATKSANFSTLLLLEKYGADLTTKHEFPFRYFACHGNVKATEYLFSKGVSKDSLQNAKFNASVYRKNKILNVING